MCIFKFESDYEKFGLAALNIVMVVVFTGTVSKATKLPTWLVVIPVAFILYKLFCLDTIFFNTEKTGIVNGIKI